MRRRIIDVVRPATERVGDREIGRAILGAFQREAASLGQVEACFERLVSRRWSVEALMRFFNGWRNPMMGSASVAGLCVRLLHLADEAQGPAREALFEAAACYGHIISEDMGLFSDTHGELYARFARALCGSDRWNQPEHAVEEASRFQTWIRHVRRRGDSIPDAMALTLAAEIYNYGEFTVIAPLLKKWMVGPLGWPDPEARRELEFVTAHVGDTERDHFLHSVRALELYARATGTGDLAATIGARCGEYLREVGNAYQALSGALLDRAAARAS